MIMIMIAPFILTLLLAHPAAGFAPLPLIAQGAVTTKPAPASRFGSSLLQASSLSDSSVPTLEAILFDCDGVLADTERDGHRLAFNIAFKNNGIDEDWSEERYGKLLEVGGGKERMTAHWNEVGWPDQIPEEGRSDKIMSLHLQKTDIFMQLIDDGKIPLRPGVLRLVDEGISNNVQLAVCSTSNEKAVSNLVSTLMGPERASKFRIFAGDMVKKKKPAPDVYLLAVEEMGLDKKKCVIIEDSHIGVGAAVAAGITCLVTKSSYTTEEDFTGAKMIVDELEGDGVTLETLTCLLGDDELVEECITAVMATTDSSSSWDRVGHVETTGATWTGARFGDQNINTPARYTPSETYQPSRPDRGIGVKIEGHIEKGGASWTGARFGDDDPNALSHGYTPSETYQPSRPDRGIGVKIEGHIEKGGASWTGARFGDDTPNAPNTYTSKPERGIGVKMEAHIEKGGASWTGARFGDDNPNASPKSYTPSETYEASKPDRGIGVKMEDHIEKGGASWTGARFGDDNPNASPKSYTPSETAEASKPDRGIGVKMENHIEKGGASWTGARFGDDDPNAPNSYTASETYPSKPDRGIGVKMEAHIEKGGASWTGARFGYDSPIASPKPSNPSETYEASTPDRGIGVKMEAHIEKGGASWTGARFGDDNPNASPKSYTPSETYEFRSRGKGSGTKWDPVAHTEVSPDAEEDGGSIGREKSAWSGARFGDENKRRCAPTPSQWHE